MLLALKLGVLVALLALAVATQNLGKIWALVSGANFHYLLLFIVVHAATAALGSGNLFLLLHPLGKTLSWPRLFYFDLLSMPGVYYTPGGIGGLGGMMFLMSREGLGLKDSAIVVVVDKTITLIVALLFMAVHLHVYYSGGLEVKWYGLAALIFLVAAGAAAMLTSGLVRQSAATIVDRLRCYGGHYRLLSANMIITIAIFGLQGLQFYGAFSAVRIEVTDWLLILSSYGVMAIIGQLPITLGGIGLSEAAAVLLWAGLGMGTEQILAVFLLIRLFTMISTLFLGGGAAVVWLLERRQVADK